MSASRKKQERKLAEAPELSAREQEELVKAEQRKRNTIIYTIIGVVVVILVAILLIWNSGVFQRNAAVATIDGEKVTPAQVSFYYHNNELSNIASYYSQIGLAMPYSPSESAKDQVIEAIDIEEWNMYGYSLDESYVGKTYHDYFLDRALNDLREEYAVRAAAKEAGYTLSEAGKADIEAQMESLDSTIETYLSYGYNFNRSTYLKQMFGSFMTEKSFRNCLENSVLASEYRQAHLDTLANYSEAELDTYYQAHTNELDTFRYYFRTFDGTAETTTDAEGNTIDPTEEQEAAALAKAEADANAALAEVQGNLDAVVDNEDYSLQLNTPAEGDFHYDWLTDPARKSGDATVIDAGYNLYYVLVFESRYLDTAPTADVRHILVEAVNEDESAEEPTDEAYAAAEATAKDLLAQWQSGEKTAESFGALAEEHSADPGSNTNGGLYTQVAQGDMIPNFNDWVFAEGRQVGDTGLVKNTESTVKGWHVIYYQGPNEPTWITSARQALWSEDVASDMEIVRTDKLDSLFN